MPSAYLQGSDPATFGASGATPQQIIQASAIIDAFLRRPEGLLWKPDGAWNPCYMEALAPQFTLLANGPISPGKAVNVQVGGGSLSQFSQGGSTATPGGVVIVDRANPGQTEACQIQAVNGNIITLTSVQYAHSGGVALETGLVVYEEKNMPADRPLTRLSRYPSLQILSMQGRYGYARKGDQNRYMVDEYNLLASMTHFGGPPVWVLIDQQQAGLNPATGELWVPAGILLAYYSQVRVWYVAGYTYASLPYEVKQACASIINALLQVSFPANLKSMKAGDTALQRFTDTIIDGDVKLMLAPFKARLWS